MLLQIFVWREYCDGYPRTQQAVLRSGSGGLECVVLSVKPSEKLQMGTQGMFLPSGSLASVCHYE